MELLCDQSIKYPFSTMHDSPVHVLRYSSATCHVGSAPPSSSDRAGYTTTVSFGMNRAGTYEKELLFVIIHVQNVLEKMRGNLEHPWRFKCVVLSTVIRLGAVYMYDVPAHDEDVRAHRGAPHVLQRT